MHGLKTKLSKINRSRLRVHYKAQPSTISHQLSTARKELSSNELREERPAPRLELDRLSADYQHIASRALVNAKCATFLQNSRQNPACHAVASPRRLVKPHFAVFRPERLSPTLHLPPPVGSPALSHTQTCVCRKSRLRGGAYAAVVRPDGNGALNTCSRSP